MAEDVRGLGPTSHYFYSQRLKLHYVDWGNAEKPPLLLLHGGPDQAALGSGAHAAMGARDAGARSAAPEAVRHARGGDRPHARGQPASQRGASAASHPERRHPARGRHLRVEVRQLRTRRLALPLQRRRGARDLEPHHLPGAARARQRVLGARPGGRRARRRVPPSADHDRPGGRTLGPPRPARRVPARGAPVPRGAVSGRVRRALVLGVLVAGCGVSPDTTRVELRGYLARTRSWAPAEAEANSAIKRILATQFVDEAEIRRQIADSRPRILTHLEHLRGYAPRSKDIARIHARYIAAWETLLGGYDAIEAGFSSGDYAKLARGREARAAWRRELEAGARGL